MDFEKRKELVLRNTEEIVTEDELDEILETRENPRTYIGYAPTGMMHIGHFATIRKVADFVDAGLDFKFLIADVHAELDVEKTPRELVDARSKYYKEGMKAMVDASGIDPHKVDFVLGSDYQHDREYQKGYMHLMENTTVRRAKRAASEVVRHKEGSMKASGVLYSFLQIMDCVALDVDIAYAGTDQRRIYMLGRETLPKIGEDKITTLLSPLLSGLSGGKMSASDEKSRVSIHDSDDEIKEKIKDAFCPEAEKKNNGVLEYLKYLVFPILDKEGEDFLIERPEKYGGDTSYSSYQELEKDYLDGKIHPQDLKKATGKYICKLIRPIRERFEGKELMEKAYPEEFGE